MMSNSAINNKPKCKLTGTDGNVFALLGKCNNTLRKAGQSSKCEELNRRIFSSGSYGEALVIMGEYVEIS